MVELRRSAQIKRACRALVQQEYEGRIRRTGPGSFVRTGGAWMRDGVHMPTRVGTRHEGQRVRVCLLSLSVSRHTLSVMSHVDKDVPKECFGLH
jgi:hypothetical protein